MLRIWNSSGLFVLKMSYFKMMQSTQKYSFVNYSVLLLKVRVSHFQNVQIPDITEIPLLENISTMYYNNEERVKFLRSYHSVWIKIVSLLMFWPILISCEKLDTLRMLLYIVLQNRIQREGTHSKHWHFEATLATAKSKLQYNGLSLSESSLHANEYMQLD